MAITTFKLPLPPSGNRYWRSAPGRGLVRSKEADEYIAEVARICSAERVRPVRGRFRMVIVPYGLRENADLNNVPKILCDALEFHAYLDDKGARRILLEWGEAEPKMQAVVVTVEPLIPGDYATPAEVEAARRSKTERNRKRKATIREGRMRKLADKHGLKPAVYR